MRTRVGVIPHIKKVSAVVLATIASLVLLASPTFALVGDVLISEFMADPVTISDANGEWIELENTTSSDIDITGWQLDDGGTAFVFTSPTIISANDFLVICRDIVLADANCNVEWPGMELTNNGDTITLKDTTSTPVDALIYASSNVVEGASTEAETEGNGNQVLTANTDIANTYTTDNTGTPGVVNSFTLPVVNTDTGEEFNTIQAAINDTDTLNGHTLELAATTFTEAVDVTKELTIDGAGEGATIIDASSFSSYSFEILKDNTTVMDFTLLGNPSGGNSGYGIKISSNTTSQLQNVTVKNVTVDNSQKTGIDLNGVIGALLENVTVQNVPSGNGISTTDSSNVAINNPITINNQWGGIALYTFGRYYPLGSDNITITGANLAEPNGLYVQVGNFNDPANPALVTNINAPQFEYVVTNDEYRPGAENFMHYQTTLANATTFGLGLQAVPPTNTDSAIRRVSDSFRVVPVELTILAAVEDAENGGTVELLDGVHSNDASQIIIDKNLTLRGGSSATSTIVEAGFSTSTGGDARGWFLVQPGAVLNVISITFDGDGENIWQAFRHKGSGSFTNVVFKNIGYNPSTNYQGTAIAAFGDGAVNVDNSEFNNIGRIGVLYFDTGVSGSVFSNNTYTGKGAGDWLDYALDISAGAEVDVNSNNISGNLGVASTDSSSSAGVLVSTFFGPGTDATIQDNYFSGNTAGVAVGFNSSDTSTVVARGNTFDGNSFGAYSTNALADFRQNFWGDNSGPTDIDEFDGSLPAANPGGTGDIAGANIWYADWNIIDTDAPLMNNINMFVNGSDSDIAKAGDTIRIVADVVDPSGVDKVQIWVRDFPFTGEQITSGEMTFVSGDTYEFVFTLPADYQSGDPIQQTFDGNYYNFRPYDNLGNSIIGYRNNFTVDNTAPATPTGLQRLLATDHSVVVPCGAVSQIVSLHPNWDDNTESDFAYYEYTSFNAPNGSIGINERVFYDSIFEYNGSWLPSEGTYGFAVRAVDNVGNKSPWSLSGKTLAGSCQITYDNTAPVVSGIVLNEQAVPVSDVRSANCEAIVKLYAVTGEIDLEATISDSVAGVSSVRYKVRKLNASGCTVSSVFSSGNVTMTNTVGNEWEDISGFDTNDVPADGDYTIMLQSTDSVGNVTTSYVDITIDNTAPVAVFTGVTTEDPSPELSGTIDDDTSTVEVTVNGNTYTATVASGTWTVAAGAINPNLAVGLYDVEVESTDPSGNVNTQNFPLSLEIEAAPVVTLPTEPDTPTEPDNGVDTGDGVVAGANTGGTGGEPFVAVQTTAEIAQSEPQVEGESTPEVLQENISIEDIDVSEDSVDDCFQIFGICWYWWIIPTAVLVAILYYYVIRKTDEE